MYVVQYLPTYYRFGEDCDYYYHYMSRLRPRHWSVPAKYRVSRNYQPCVPAPSQAGWLEDVQDNE